MNRAAALAAYLVAVFVSTLSEATAQVAIDLVSKGAVTQSGGAATPGPASRAIDGNVSTFSETTNVAGSFWQIELNRAFQLTRIDLTAPSNPAYDGVVNGLIVKVSNLQDQLVYQTNVSGVALGGTWSHTLPSPVDGRIIRFELPNGQPNGAGDFRVAIAEVKTYGDPSVAFGPTALAAIGTVSETGNTAANAALAIDGKASTFSDTADVLDSFWQLTLDRTRPISRIELVNRSDANGARMQGLTLRILDDSLNTVATASVTNPGTGATWVYQAPSGTMGRYIRVGLEGGAVNGQGNRIVSLAEVNVLTASNYAQASVSYMTRSYDGLLPTSNVNDGNFGTEVITSGLSGTPGTVDGYFEVDLGQTRALYSVRAVAASGLQVNVTHTTASVFDAAHNLVYAKHLGGTAEVFDVDLPGPVLARYVRIGLEYKERTDPSSNTRVFGLKELQAFGRPAGEVGILNFTATQTQISGGASTDLQWQQEGLYQLKLYPTIGSVGASTTTAGTGTLTVAPAQSVEYVLVGSNYASTFTNHLTIEVDSQKLPSRISEFVASNRLSLRDGDGGSPDWIELHNPNNTPLDLTGHFLSDDSAAPFKWPFPPGVTIPAHGYLIVFASDSNNPYDAGGFLHANFNLSVDGGSVVLTGPGGTVDSALNYPAQQEDLAYGRTLDGVWKFLEPTPAQANVATAYEGWLQPLTFSHQRGFYTTPISLTIFNPNPSSQLFYSTNGTEPTTPYTGAINISNVAGIRAAVKRDGYKPPRTQTHSYIFTEGMIASSLMDTSIKTIYGTRLRQGLAELPTFSVNVPPTDGTANSERPEREASVEIFMPDGSPPIQANCGIEQYGGAFGLGTGNPYAKFSYQLKFRAEFGTRKLQMPLFRGFDHGVPVRESFDQLNLHAGNHDMPFTGGRGFSVSQRYAADTMLDMGSLNPHGRFVHLYVNGQYRGLFDAHEPLTDAFLSEYMGGAKEDYLSVKGNDNGPSNAFILGIPDPDPPGRLPWENMRANRNSYLAVKDALDVPNLIDFMIVWNWGNAENEYRSAGARTPGPGRGFKFWIADADGHLRLASGESGQLNKNQISASPNAGPAQLFGALLAQGHPDFKALLADRIYKHFFNGGAMTSAANLARLNLRTAEMFNGIVADCARWTSITGRTPANWDSDAQNARTDIIPVRSTTILSQMRTAGWYPSIDAPVFNLYGGNVGYNFPLTVSTPIGTIYYTLDGSDPRLPGGGISPSAIAGGGTVNLLLQNNVQFKARVLDGATWSALTDTYFQVAHSLATGPYFLNSWSATSAAGSYPNHMRFEQTTVRDPGLAVDMTGLWKQPYNLTNASRIRGLGSDGIAFVNTDTTQDVLGGEAPGAGYVGTAVLALNTTGQSNIRVSWTGGTVESNTQIYGIRLQYRVGNSGAFTDVLDAVGNPVEYIRNATAGHSQTMGPVTLPVAAENKAYVELRWKYYYISGIIGSRAQLRVDNIIVASGDPTAVKLAILSAPPTGQTNQPLRPITVEAQSQFGERALTYNGSITLIKASGPGTLSGTLSMPAINGDVTFYDVRADLPGSYRFIAQAASLVDSDESANVIVAQLTELILPGYLQGEQPDNNNRVPFAARLRIDGLLPNATYRYANRIVTSGDPVPQDGAGNMILARTGGSSFIRITQSPRFLPADLNLRHGQFVTDSQGSYAGWFITEPTSNSRFSPGTMVLMRLLLNDGVSGEDYYHFLTAQGPIKVAAFGSGPIQGSAVYGESTAAPKNFMVLYSNLDGTGRPVAATFVESSGVAVVSPPYAPFYQTFVAGLAGHWGTLVPNGLPAGVQRIEERDLATGNLVSAFLSIDGNRPTKSLSSGTAAVGIRVPGSGASGYELWQARHFTLSELGNANLSGQLADPNGDGLPNLLSHAFGLNPYVESSNYLPVIDLVEISSEQYIRYRYRRLLVPYGLQYAVESTETLADWATATGGTTNTAPNGDGLTETVTVLYPKGSVARDFLRLRVTVP